MTADLEAENEHLRGELVRALGALLSSRDELRSQAAAHAQRAEALRARTNATAQHLVNLKTLGHKLDAVRQELTARAEHAEGLLAELIAVEPVSCRYDHHDLCQSHWLHERPCPVERARQLLAATTPQEAA